MELSLQGVSHKVGAQQHLYPMDLRLVPNAVTVLLGATQAGKTTLMRLMAGLDRPTVPRRNPARSLGKRAADYKNGQSAVKSNVPG